LTFQNHTNRPLTDFGGKTSIFSHPVYLFLREFSLQDFRGGSNIMSPAKLREKWDELVIRLGRSPAQRCVNHISEPDTEIPPGFRG
ncbi:hypothetical protein F7F12_26635, partial [Escherichia coli]